MSAIKKLAGQTAIYGLSSIIGRFLNYLLVPIHTDVFQPDRYGVITEMYAYVAFLVIMLTYGMETAFFRFTNNPEHNKKKVFSTTLVSLLTTTTVFIALATTFSDSIATWMKYPDNAEYVTWFAFIVGLDAISSIPLARLRVENKPITFALANLTSVGVNIGLNLFFLLYCMPQYNAGNSNFLIETFYSPEIGVGYVFIANLMASITKFLFLTPWMFKAKLRIDTKLLKLMIAYAMPLLVAGLAGIINETLDRILLKYLLFPIKGEEGTMSIVGIYGACYKVSIIITLFIQAFRYAAEPFFFSQQKEANAKDTYAQVMNYFVIVCATIFLGVMLYLDFVKYFIPNEDYWVGLKVVPILLFANIFLGIFYNQSIWFKLSDKTRWGAILAIVGAVITIVINFIWIPRYTYEASAWATMICYGSMMILSYFLGQKYYPVPYNVKKVISYLGFSLGLYLLSTTLSFEGFTKYAAHTLILITFLGVIFVMERKNLKLG